jgi:hypothetical protein
MAPIMGLAQLHQAGFMSPPQPLLMAQDQEGQERHDGKGGGHHRQHPAGDLGTGIAGAPGEVAQQPPVPGGQGNRFPVGRHRQLAHQRLVQAIGLEDFRQPYGGQRNADQQDVPLLYAPVGGPGFGLLRGNGGRGDQKEALADQDDTALRLGGIQRGAPCRGDHPVEIIAAEKFGVPGGFIGFGGQLQQPVALVQEADEAGLPGVAQVVGLIFHPARIRLNGHVLIGFVPEAVVEGQLGHMVALLRQQRLRQGPFALLRKFVLAA